MLISTIEELRLHFSAHALDSLEPLAGILDNSEHECLQEKLGNSLYEYVTTYYSSLDKTAFLEDVAENGTVSSMEQLLLLCQRVIVYDTFARAIGVMPLSVNNAGVNVTVADDYQKPDKDTIATFRATCYAELASTTNRLLQLLEQWVESGSSEEEQTVAEKWKSSRYYYLAGELFVPSAKVLQEYLDIHENRLKFIQMLPDLRFIQEDVLVESFGETFLNHLVDAMVTGNLTDIEKIVVHKLRKIVARHLAERSGVLSCDKNTRAQAHDEAVALTRYLVAYLVAHQSSFDEQYIKDAPWYVVPVSTTDTDDKPKEIPADVSFNGNERKAFFAMPGLV